MDKSKFAFLNEEYAALEAEIKLYECKSLARKNVDLEIKCQRLIDYIETLKYHCNRWQEECSERYNQIEDLKELIENMISETGEPIHFRAKFDELLKKYEEDYD